MTSPQNPARAGKSAAPPVGTSVRVSALAAFSEADRIKCRLRRCVSAAEVHEVADQERKSVLALADDPETKPLAIHIANFKAHRLNALESE